MARNPGRKPKLAVWKFASCDGCQLSILDCEDRLLELAGAIDIAYFPEATSTKLAGPYDLSLVEGAVTTPDDMARLKSIRRQSRRVVAIGACATAGGIQALRNFAEIREYTAVVYARPEYISTLATATPIAQHITVDFELRGCPVDKAQLLEVIAAYLQARSPNIPSQSVCMECKVRGSICVAVAHGTGCLGPVTQAGCGAICPAFRRGCYGCFGPVRHANTAALAEALPAHGVGREDIHRLFRTFNAAAPEFQLEAERHAQEPGGS